MPRRTFLRGLGTLVALPVLDSLLPASARAAVAAPVDAFPRRVAWIYIPNGANMADWTPKATGTGFELPRILDPLKANRSDFTVLSGLANHQGDALGDGGGGHARASASYLSGVHPRKTAGADIKAGVTVDQIAASHVGGATRLPSLELTCDNGQRAGSCDSGYSCAYQFNMSWRTETQPVPAEVDPRAAFERLFGGGDPAETLEASTRRTLYRRSVLDYVLDDTRGLGNRLDDADRRKLDEYLTSVREIEQRIERAGQFATPKVPDGASEPGMFETYGEQVRLMYDILALAFQTDSTRIATFCLAHDGSNRPYPFIGIPEGHHDLSHHRNDEVKKGKLAQINRWHVEQLAYFMNRLKGMKEGEGSVLDHCLLSFGSGLSDGNTHSPENLPVILAGGGGGAVRPGAHVRVDDKTPMTNLYRSMLGTIGVPTEKIGDSTGRLEAVFTPAA